MTRSLRHRLFGPRQSPELGLTRRAGCPCGQKATYCIRSETVGGIPREFWTCEEHKDVSCFMNGRARWRHQGTCPQRLQDGWGGPEDDPYWVDCPHRTHEEHR